MNPMLGSDDLSSDINVTPLVDVVLVLLVILLMVAPILREELPVEVPVAAHADAARAEGPPTLAIAADGSLMLAGAPLPDEDLPARLAAIYAGRADKSVLVAADRRLRYARVVAVLDACRAAGIERIGIVTAAVPERDSGAQHRALPGR